MRAPAGHLSQSCRVVGPAGLPAARARIFSGPHFLRSDRCRHAGALRLFQTPRLFRQSNRTPRAARALSFARRTRFSLAAASPSGSRRRAASWMCASGRCGLKSGLGALAAREPRRRIHAARDRVCFLDRTAAGNPRLFWRADRARRRARTPPPNGRALSPTLSKPTQDELAARSCRRDPAEWRMLNRGAVRRRAASTTHGGWLRATAARRKVSPRTSAGGCP